jgi:hypothetical protein
LATHYQRLGVAPSASTEEIRGAYRDLARRLHPDRQGDASSAERALAGRRMREVNEAWRTLGDPVRRHEYDLTLRPSRQAAGRPSVDRSRATAPVPAPEDDDDDLIDVMGEIGPLQAQVVRGLPWVLLLVVFGAIFVFTAYATAGKKAQTPATPRVPATVALGSCLNVRTGPMPPATTVVPCSGAHDVKLVTRVDERTPCPPGTQRRRLATDGLLDCVVPS